jgi:hypothetical protein
MSCGENGGNKSAGVRQILKKAKTGKIKALMSVSENLSAAGRNARPQPREN